MRKELAFFLYAGLCQDLAAVCQNTQAPLQPIPGHSSDTWSGASNRWQLSAVDIQKQVDPVPFDVRAARNTYWLSHVERREPKGASGPLTFVPDGSYLDSSQTQEFPSDKDAIWVAATFESYRVISADAGYEYLYTEIVFRLDRVFGSQSSSGISSGSVIDVDFSGGRIKTPNGKLLTSALKPRPGFVQPGHKYLLELIPGFPQGTYMLLKHWDLTTGKVMPDQPDEIQRAARGKSAIDGMPAAQALDYLQSVLPPNKK